MKNVRIKVWHAHIVIHDKHVVDEPYITKKEIREELTDTVGNGVAGLTVVRCKLKLAGYKGAAKKGKKK